MPECFTSQASEGDSKSKPLLFDTDLEDRREDLGTLKTHTPYAVLVTVFLSFGRGRNFPRPFKVLLAGLIIKSTWEINEKITRFSYIHANGNFT